ncbi:MAG: PIG-L deacetylase family protein [Pseudomonadota bacterium]
MLTLPLSRPDGQPLSVLCLGAHCDDIEIGCGATLLTLAEQSAINVHWQVFTSTPERRLEAEAGAKAFGSAARELSVEILDFRDGFLPYEGTAVKEAFEALKQRVQPDLIFTHYGRDAHQDHRLVSELTWNTFRNHLVLEYEIPKWDGDLGQPSVFCAVDAETAARKIALLQQTYNSQNQKRWFTDDLFHSLMRIRGMEANAPDNLAEAFFARKLSLGPGHAQR